MKRWHWVVLAVGGFVVAVVVWLPASLVVRLMPGHVQVRMLDVRGTVWTGNAGGIWVNGRGLGSLSWRIEPLGLLRGRIDADVILQGELVGSAKVQRGFSHWRVEQATATLPADWMAPLLASPGLYPRGRLQVALSQAEHRDGQWQQLDGSARWTEAVLAGPGASAALGELQADWTLGPDRRVIGEIRDNGGPLAVSGTFNADLAHYQAELHLLARDPAVAPALQWLGEAQADGGRLLRLDGGRR